MDTSVPKTYLSPQEEDEIANVIQQSSDRGFGKTKGELLLTVKEMLDFRGRRTKWDDNMPTDKWFRNFKLRHPQIVLRAAQKLGKQRAFVIKDSILNWFETFKTTVSSIDATILLDPSRIYNCDESGFSLDAGTGRVLAFMGTKFVYRVGSEQKTMITVLVCCSGSGHFTRPMLIYPGSQLRGFRPQEVFKESFITNSPNGWTNQTIFSNWLESVFIPQTSSLKKPVLLLVDGHISHQSVRAASLCKENDVILYSLPPHSSHLVQPLDVGVFKTLKAEWRKAVRKQNEEETITKRTFANIFKEAYNVTVEKNLCPQAFRSCGLYPFDPQNIEWQKVMPSTLLGEAALSSSTTTETTASSVPTTTSNASSSSATTETTVSSAPTTTSIASSSSTTTETITSPVPTMSSITPSSSATIVHIASSSATAIGPSVIVTFSSSTLAALGPSTSSSTSSLTSTLRKFAMICSQIGDTTLLKYYERLEEGYDCEDAMYSLWKSYHHEIIFHDKKEMTSHESLPKPKATQDPLSVPTLKHGTVRRRQVPKLPPLISGTEFIDHLVRKDLAAKEEEERKAKRKVDMERKKQGKAAAMEEKRKEKERWNKRS